MTREMAEKLIQMKGVYLTDEGKKALEAILNYSKYSEAVTTAK